MISIDELHSELEVALPSSWRRIVQVLNKGESGLQLKIDGSRCLTSIGVWPNGLCDVDYLFVATERGEFRHFELADVQSAKATVMLEVALAVERA
jgi:hypothetical protein